MTIDNAQLTIDYDPLAIKIAQRHKAIGAEWDDLLQAARCGLCEAANRYDAEKGAFGPYAAQWILGEVRNLLRQRKNNNQLSIVHCQLSIEEAAAEEPGFERTEQQMLAASVLNRLPTDQKQALVLVYLKSMTQAQAARVMGCTQARVSRLCARGLAAARE